MIVHGLGVRFFDGLDKVITYSKLNRNAMVTLAKFIENVQRAVRIVLSHDTRERN